MRRSANGERGVGPSAVATTWSVAFQGESWGPVIRTRTTVVFEGLPPAAPSPMLVFQRAGASGPRPSHRKSRAYRPDRSRGGPSFLPHECPPGNLVAARILRGGREQAWRGEGRFSCALNSCGLTDRA